MNITKEAKEKSQMQLTVEVSIEDFKPFIEKAAQKISNDVDIPGFRKGQAPIEVVSKKVGEMTLLQEAASFAVEKTLPEAIKQESLETVGQPSINIEKLAPENPFIYSAIVPLMPAITLAEASSIKATKDAVEIKDEEIDQVIEHMRGMRAKEVLVDREAQKKDKVEVNFQVFLDSIPIDGGSSQKYPLVLGDDQMIPGFEDQIIGMKKDEEKEFKLDFPKEYHNKQLAGKNADFKVKIISVFERQVPELDEAFLSEAGEFESIDAMKDEIEKNLREEKTQKAEGKFEKEIIEGLIEQSTFEDIPETMVTQETQQMISELERNIAQQGLKFDDYLIHLKKDRQQLSLDFAPDAVRRIKSALAIRTLAKQEKITPTDEEITEELGKLQQAYAINPQMLKQVNSPSYRDYIATVLRNKQTLKWLKDQVSSGA